MRIFLLGALLLLTKGQTQTPTPPLVSGGINFFSVKQDGEIGLELSREAERVLPLVRDGSANRYLYYIAQRLRRDLPEPAVQFRIRIVNSKEVNSLGVFLDQINSAQVVFNHPYSENVLDDLDVEIERISSSAPAPSAARAAHTTTEFRVFHSTLQKIMYPVVAEKEPEEAIT